MMINMLLNIENTRGKLQCMKKVAALPNPRITVSNYTMLRLCDLVAIQDIFCALRVEYRPTDSQAKVLRPDLPLKRMLPMNSKVHFFLYI